LPDLAQRMLGRDKLFEIDIAKQRPAFSSVPRIFTPDIAVRRGNHVLNLLSRRDYFSSLLKDLITGRRENQVLTPKNAALLLRREQSFCAK
jgi:hypothetical protein